MSKNKKPRKAYRPRAESLTVDPIEQAKRRAALLSDADVREQFRVGSLALAALQAGAASIPMGGSEQAHAVCTQHWRSLADQANMAETFAAMGLGSGPQARAVVAEAQLALASIFERRKTLGYWQCTGPEADALGWLLSLYSLQLASVSYGEFERAFQATANRIRQAAAGNASPRTVVVTGDLGQKSEAFA